MTPNRYAEPIMSKDKVTLGEIKEEFMIESYAYNRNQTPEHRLMTAHYIDGLLDLAIKKGILEVEIGDE